MPASTQMGTLGYQRITSRGTIRLSDQGNNRHDSQRTDRLKQTITQDKGLTGPLGNLAAARVSAHTTVTQPPPKGYRPIGLVSGSYPGEHVM